MVDRSGPQGSQVNLRWVIREWQKDRNYLEAERESLCHRVQELELALRRQESMEDKLQDVPLNC